MSISTKLLIRIASFTFRPRKGDLLISGYGDKALGHAVAANYISKSLDRAGFGHVFHDHSDLLVSRNVASSKLPTNEKGGVWIVCCNAPEASELFTKVRIGDWKHKYRIGYWAYELPKAPKSWLKQAYLFHEIWVPSQFVADSLRGINKPIRVMPFDVLSSLQDQPKKSYRRADKFRITCAGDLRSSITRKNIAGAISIYKKAFPVPSKYIELIVKINTTDAPKNSLEQLSLLMTNRQDVHVLSNQLTRPAILQLLNDTDLFLAPHRAEGFGLMIAEAMALGTPVLATGWSGNMEYMQDIPRLQIPYELVSVIDPDGVYGISGSQEWAEPDLAAAALTLKEITSAPAEVAALGRLAKDKLKVLKPHWEKRRLSTMHFAKYVSRSSKTK